MSAAPAIDVAVVGAGAAGLMAAIWAGRAGRAVVALDGATHLGRKILVAGGGRCNVTNAVVDETAFCGSSRNAIRKVLRRFDVERTIGFFGGIGVDLREEAAGKLFPTTDRSRSVLEGLVGAAQRAGVRLVHPWRVAAIGREVDGFSLRAVGGGPALHARRVILATGGRALPRSGSDGLGYEIASSLGNPATPQVFPALVPLRLPHGHPLTGLSGISAPASLEVRAGSGARLASLSGPVLCTHFGLSGPAILDVSRHWTAARLGDPGAQLVASWLPAETAEALDAKLRALGSASPLRLLRERLPERLARTLCRIAGVDPAAPAHLLVRERRRALVAATVEMALPVIGDRGFDHAEVTAGGIPLAQLRLDTLESRACPGLHFCGEVCDVDGRIGGFNFQWAWASGFVAGTGAAAALP